MGAVGFEEEARPRLSALAQVAGARESYSLDVSYEPAVLRPGMASA